MDPLAQVGRHDERATSDAVGDDTAREQEDQVRRRINRNPNPKLERTAAQLKDLEWTCDVQDERAEKTMVDPATGACVDGGCSTGSTGGSGWLSLRSQIATSNVAVIAEPHLTANQVSIGSRNHCAGRIRRKRRPRNESCTSPIRKSPGAVWFTSRDVVYENHRVVLSAGTLAREGEGRSQPRGRGIDPSLRQVFEAHVASAHLPLIVLLA